jgi:hypothetical protein
VPPPGGSSAGWRRWGDCRYKRVDGPQRGSLAALQTLGEAKEQINSEWDFAKGKDNIKKESVSFEQMIIYRKLQVTIASSLV